MLRVRQPQMNDQEAGRDALRQQKGPLPPPEAPPRAPPRPWLRWRRFAHVSFASEPTIGAWMAWRTQTRVVEPAGHVVDRARVVIIEMGPGRGLRPRQSRAPRSPAGAPAAAARRGRGASRCRTAVSPRGAALPTGKHLFYCGRSPPRRGRAPRAAARTAGNARGSGGHGAACADAECRPGSACAVV